MRSFSDNKENGFELDLPLKLSFFNEVESVYLFKMIVNIHLSCIWLESVSIYLLPFISIYLSIYLLPFISIYLSASISYPFISIYLSIHLLPFISIYLSIHLLPFISIYLSIYLSQCLIVLHLHLSVSINVTSHHSVDTQTDFIPNWFSSHCHWSRWSLCGSVRIEDCSIQKILFRDLARNLQNRAGGGCTTDFSGINYIGSARQVTFSKQKRRRKLHKLLSTQESLPQMWKPS